MSTEKIKVWYKCFKNGQEEGTAKSQQPQDHVNYIFWLGRYCPSRTRMPFQAKQLIRSTTSMFFVGWVIQYNKNGRSYEQLVISSFITTTCLLLYHVSWRVHWRNIKPPRWLSPSAAQIWCPVTSDFSQNYNHLWKRRSFRPLMRFRKIGQGSWW